MIYSVDDLIKFNHQQSSQFLVDVVTSRKLTLKHPSKDVVTFIRQSKRYRKANVVLFSDEDLKNQWYLVQIYNLADGYICDGKVSNPIGSGEIPEFNELLNNGDIRFNTESKTSCVDGLLFSQVRPYHYIYDQLINYFELDKIQSIAEYCFTDKNCFYSELPDGNRLKPAKENGCYLFPCTEGDRYDSSAANEMHTFIRRNSEAKVFSSELTLWFGITAQKRSWLEQANSCCRIVKQLRAHYSTITVIIDGWTALDGGTPDSPKDIARDTAVFDSISSELSKVDGIELISIIGKDYKEKVSYAKASNFFVANSGSGGIVPIMFTQSKGVIHTNGRLHTFERSYNESISIVPNHKILAQKHAIDAGVYSIDWTVIYNLLVDLIGIDKKIPEKKLIKSQFYFTLKRFLFKKKIQAGLYLGKKKNDSKVEK